MKSPLWSLHFSVIVTIHCKVSTHILELNLSEESCDGAPLNKATQVIVFQTEGDTKLAIYKGHV